MIILLILLISVAIKYEACLKVVLIYFKLQLSVNNSIFNFTFYFFILIGKNILRGISCLPKVY
jgi:hypothetical protein